jgi:hypothetical protein
MSIETCPLSIEDIQSELEEIREIATKNNNKKMFEKALSLIDLTTLNSTDTVSSVAAFTEKVNQFPAAFQQCGRHLCLPKHGSHGEKQTESSECENCRSCRWFSVIDDIYKT